MSPAPDERPVSDPPGDAPLPASLRILRLLVIGLLAAMIAGVLVMIWVVVTRVPQLLQGGPEIPAEISLPPGETPSAVTFGKGWTGVVTESGRLLIFGKDGSLRQEVRIRP